jgi:ABC-type nickel/cobalt efflux system permease component RcnA
VKVVNWDECHFGLDWLGGTLGRKLEGSSKLEGASRLHRASLLSLSHAPNSSGYYYYHHHHHHHHHHDNFNCACERHQILRQHLSPIRVTLRLFLRL